MFRTPKLSLSSMQWFALGSILAEPGIRLVDFATVTLKSGLSVPHGGCETRAVRTLARTLTRSCAHIPRRCGTVGFGGHFQSSAWGMMSHSHGESVPARMARHEC